jgi:2-phosphosulfolactate phosphatase
MLQGFDYGNSPAQIEHVDFKGKTIIHTTSAGTQGLTNASSADEIITGSFVNAKAVARYILSKNPEELSLVAMGYEGRIPSDEDTLCARYIESIIVNKPFELVKVEEILRSGSGKRFFDPANQAWSPQRDFHLCMYFNRFDFVLRAEKNPGGSLHLVRIPC